MLDWWKNAEADIPTWASSAQKVLLVQSSSASDFSLLNDEQQLFDVPKSGETHHDYKESREAQDGVSGLMKLTADVRDRETSKGDLTRTKDEPECQTSPLSVDKTPLQETVSGRDESSTISMHCQCFIGKLNVNLPALPASLSPEAVETGVGNYLHGNMRLFRCTVGPGALDDLNLLPLEGGGGGSGGAGNV